MAKYTFLFKPVFFIFNLLFATWLVFEIEKISPSQIGGQGPLHDTLPGLDKEKKEQLKKICFDFKAGLLDSTLLEQKLDKFFWEIKKRTNDEAAPAKGSF